MHSQTTSHGVEEQTNTMGLPTKKGCPCTERKLKDGVEWNGKRKHIAKVDNPGVR